MGGINKFQQGRETLIGLLRCVFVNNSVILRILSMMSGHRKEEVEGEEEEEVFLLNFG